MQIAVLEEQKKAAEPEESADDEAKPTSADENTEEQARRTDGYGEKPDINDVPVDENQVCRFLHTPLIKDGVRSVMSLIWCAKLFRFGIDRPCEKTPPFFILLNWGFGRY